MAELKIENKKGILLLTGVIFVLLLVFFAGRELLESYYFKGGVTALSEKNYSLARQNLSTATSIKSDNPVAYAYLGRAVLGPERWGQDPVYPEANYREAIDYSLKAVEYGIEKTNPELHAAVLARLGYSYMQIKDYDKANEYFLKHIELYPENSLWSRFHLAQDYFTRAQKPKEALEILLSAPGMAKTKIDKENLYYVYTLLARLSRYEGKYEDAERYARLSIEGRGNSTNDAAQIAYNVLAIMVGQKKEFEKSREYVKQSNTLAGKDVYGCVLASAYYHGKNYAPAIVTAKEALKKEGSASVHSVCLLVLADSYKEQNNFREAKKYYQEYLSRTTPTNMFEVRGIKRAQDELEQLK